MNIRARRMSRRKEEEKEEDEDEDEEGNVSMISRSYRAGDTGVLLKFLPTPTDS